jgi:hypothetical protein
VRVFELTECSQLLELFGADVGQLALTRDLGLIRSRGQSDYATALSNSAGEV